MQRLLLLFFGFLLLTAKLSAQQTDTTQSINGSDLLALDDGSFLRGHMVEKKSDLLKFHDNTVGDVTLRSSHVKWLVHIETGTTYRISTRNETYFGKLAAADTRGLQLETSVMGLVSIPYKSIEQITQSNGKQPELLATVDESPQSGDPNFTHYFLSPSAIPIERDVLTYRNTEIVNNSLHYGVTDHVSIYGGLSGFIAPYFGVRGGWKLGEQSYLGGTIMAGGFPFGLGSGGIYAVGGLAAYTYGNESRNLTAGIGYGFAGGDGDLLTPEQPVYCINGMIKTGRRAVLMSENWIAPITSYRNGSSVIEYNSFHIFGLRVIANQRSWDMGILTSPYFWNHGWEIGLIPVVSYSLKF